MMRDNPLPALISGLTDRWLPPAKALWTRIERPVRYLTFLAIVLILARNLHAIGWASVLQNLPASGWFYAVFILNYLGLPFYETWIYHILWRTGPRILVPLLRKRIYNEAVLEYSGEAMFFLWARKHLGIEQGEVFRTVREVNILSVLAANTVTLVIILIAVSYHSGIIHSQYAGSLWQGALFIGLIVILMTGFLVIFGKRFITMPPRKVAEVTALHSLRLLTFLGLQALQWHFALPQMAWSNWIAFLAVQMAITRLPFVPAKELIFASIAINLGGSMHVTAAALAGLFLTNAALNLLVHGVTFAGSHLGGMTASDRTDVRPSGEADESGRSG